MTLPKFVMFGLFLLLAGTTTLVQGACRVTPEPCDFPFTHERNMHDSCISHNATDAHVCITKRGGDGDTTWGFSACNEQCFNDAGAPLIFEGDDHTMSIFCKAKLSPCIFPFTYNGVEYSECTGEGTDGSYKWCATLVDVNSGEMVENFWGKCDEEACKEPEEPVEMKVAETKFERNGLTVDLVFQQENDDSAVQVDGTVSGLTPGKHGFHVHEFANDGDDCVAAGGHFNPEGVDHAGPSDPSQHDGDFGNIVAGDDGVATISLTLPFNTMFGDETVSILGKTIVIHEKEDDLGLGVGDAEAGSKAVGNSGARLACGLILERSSEWDLTLIIIIVLVVVILLLLLLICCLVYCCCCRKDKGKQRIPGDDPDGCGNGLDANGKKIPLYDELSIPFIDASPAPTPKTGRSTERLSFFHRTASIGRSRGSLSSIEKNDVKA